MQQQVAWMSLVEMYAAEELKLCVCCVSVCCVQGFKAAVGLVGAASREQERQQKQRKQKDGK
jgi:hypothetical protein